MIVYGPGLLTCAILVVPWKNSTIAMLPSLSDALAATVILAGAVNVALFAGALSDTAGTILPCPNKVPNAPKLAPS